MDNGEQNTEERPISMDKLVAWPRVAAISAMVAFSLPTFISGIEIYQALSVTDTILALLIGSIILTVIGAIMGGIGAKTRMSSYLLVRVAFGDKGAGVVNLAFALSLIGWFGVNIDLFANAVNRLLDDSFGITISNWIIEVCAGCCMIVTTIVGFKAINVLASLMIPVLAIVTWIMFSAAHSELSFGQFWHIEKLATLNLSDGVAAIVGGIIIGAIILPDITRFCRDWKGGVYTAFWAYMVVELFVLFVAVYAAAATGYTEILSLMLALGLGLVAFVIVIAGSWVLNSLNLYSTMLSLEATSVKVKGKAFTCLFGGLGVVAAFFDILDFFITFLVFLSALFIPVAGVIIVDCLWLNRAKYNYQSLSVNSRLNLSAFIAWAAGAAVAVFEDMIRLTPINALDAMLITALIYTALIKWEKSRIKRSNALGGN